MDWINLLADAVSATQPTTQAAAAAEGGGKSFWETGLLGWYVTGGRFMLPLFICQVIALGVIIERWGAYKAISIDTKAFRKKIKSLLSRNQVDDAIGACDATPGPVAATLAVGLRKFKLLKAIGRPADQIESEVTKSIDDYGVHIIAILERHIPMLASVSALAPLFGFLGTVDGMVIAFADIESAAGSGNIIQITAAGIKVALYTTILGLCIGIPAQLFFNTFTSRVNEFVLEVEESASELIQNLALMTALGAEALGQGEDEPEAVTAGASA